MSDPRQAGFEARPCDSGKIWRRRKRDRAVFWDAVVGRALIPQLDGLTCRNWTVDKSGSWAVPLKKLWEL